MFQRLSEWMETVTPRMTVENLDEIMREVLENAEREDTQEKGVAHEGGGM